MVGKNKIDLNHYITINKNNSMTKIKIKECDIKFYGECHDNTKNSHKYYLVYKVEESIDLYKSAYGRIPGFGNKGSVQFVSISSLRDANEKISKKRKKYKKVSSIPSWLQKMVNIAIENKPNMWLQLQELLNNKT
tara:strand:- start:79 stop:483 length:405 start_codon:yes stop_codon:yes gene_type:complete